MRICLIMVALILAAGSARAESVVVPSIVDGQMRHLGTSIQGDNASNALAVRPITVYEGRAFAVFAIDSLPVEYESALLAFDLETLSRGVFEIAFYGSTAKTMEWEFDPRKPLVFVGTVELDGPAPCGPFTIDATEALRAIMAAGPTYVIAKFFIRTGSPGPTLTIRSNESGPAAGPRLVFDGIVPVKARSLGGLKSLFR